MKRSAAIAIANMIGNTATAYGSYMYPESAAPQYIPGGSANAAICIIVAGMAIMLRFVHKHENKKLEAAEQGPNDTETADVDQARRHTGFRYIF